MRKLLLISLVAAAPMLLGSTGASAWGWGCGSSGARYYGYSTPRVYGYSSTDRLGASMVRVLTVGVPDWASAEWDMADCAAAGRE